MIRTAGPQSGRKYNFAILWLGQVVSQVGYYGTAIAYPLLILDITKSTVLARLVGTIALIARLLLQLPAGAIVDRGDAKSTLLRVDAFRFVVLTALCLVILLATPPWWIILVAAVFEACGNVFFNPAESVLVRKLVHEDDLGKALSANEGRIYGATFVGPLVGGVLFSVGRIFPFVADALSYAVSWLTLRAVAVDSTRERKVDERKSNLASEIWHGVSRIFSDPFFRTIFCILPIVNLAFDGIVLSTTFALHDAHYGGAAIGFAQGGIAAGAVLGAAVGSVQRKFTSVWLLLVVQGVIGAALTAAAAGLASSLWVVLPISLTFVLAPLANASLSASVMTKMPPELQGRSLSTVLVFAQGLAAVGPVASGLLVARVSSSAAFDVWALLFLVAAVASVAGWRRDAARSKGSPTTKVESSSRGANDVADASK